MPSLFYRLQAIMSQRYSGDITIVPEIGYSEFLKVLSNPTPQSVMEAIIRGERATWPSKFYTRALMGEREEEKKIDEKMFIR